MQASRQNNSNVSMGEPSGAEWIRAHWQDLPVNHWVAATANGKEAEAETIDELRSKLEDKRVEPADVTIVFITEDATC